MRPDGAAIPIPWREVWRWAALGTVALAALVLLHLQWSGGNPVGLVQPGLRGPSVEVFRTDFPDTELPDGTGHDGQQFYAVARAPMHLDEVAEHLDRPQYRLQRPLYAWLAWSLHPTGGGVGLVAAMFAVNVAAVLLGCVATGVLATTLRGPAWAGLLFAALPGTFAAVRISTADVLALALTMAALAASARGRQPLAAGAGSLAVLAKEPLLLVLAGWWLGRRRLRELWIVVVPAGVAATWWLCLRLTVPAGDRQVEEFVLPLTGLWHSADEWLDGRHPVAAVLVVATVIVLVWFLVRRPPAHPLWWPALTSAVLLPFLNLNVIGLSFNAARTLAPTLLLSVLGLLTPHAVAAREEPAPMATA